MAKKPKKELTVRQMIAVADEALKDEPKPEGREPVIRFALPLDYGPPTNAYSEMTPYQRHRLKRGALAMMFTQAKGRARAPLAGKPLLYCVRFSSKKTDAETQWHKIMVDRLTPNFDGLGYIVDDSPDHVELKSEWQQVPPGKGFIYMEIWTDPTIGRKNR